MVFLLRLREGHHLTLFTSAVMPPASSVVSLLKLAANWRKVAKDAKRSSKESKRERRYEVRLAHPPVCAVSLTEIAVFRFMQQFLPVLLCSGVRNHIRVSPHPNVLEAYEEYEDSDLVYIIAKSCEETALLLFRGGHVAEDKIGK